jgi:hypothetical protein
MLSQERTPGLRRSLPDASNCGRDGVIPERVLGVLVSGNPNHPQQEPTLGVGDPQPALMRAILGVRYELGHPERPIVVRLPGLTRLPPTVGDPQLVEHPLVELVLHRVGERDEPRAINHPFGTPRFGHIGKSDVPRNGLAPQFIREGHLRGRHQLHYQELGALEGAQVGSPREPSECHNDDVISTVEWKRAVRPLLDPKADWGFRGKLAFVRPVDWVLTGLLAEGWSLRPDTIYVWVVSVPLFVPMERLSMNFGHRVPNGSATFGLHNAAALGDAVGVALAELPTPEQALEEVASSADEANAYAAILLGDTARALGLLGAPFFAGDDRPFTVAARERRRLIGDVLEREGAEGAKALLRGWRDHTVTALRVG